MSLLDTTHLEVAAPWAPPAPSRTAKGEPEPPKGLVPVTLGDKCLFDHVFKAHLQPTSDYSFANTFIWGSRQNLYWRLLEQHLCLFALAGGELTMMLPPVPLPLSRGSALRHCLQGCFEIMDANQDRRSRRGASRIDYVCAEALLAIREAGLPGLRATPAGGDYVYDMKRMIDLAGGSLQPKRNGRNRFLREHPDHETRELAPGDLKACLALLERWRQSGDSAHPGERTDTELASSQLRSLETLACERALLHQEALGLTGMTLWAGDRLAGFTLGEALACGQASILIEKTDPGIRGSAQFLFSEFCRQHWSQHSECNAGDDWGIPSLRFTKQSYRPLRLLPKHTLTCQGPLVLSPAPSRPAPSLRLARPADACAILALEKVSFKAPFNTRQVRYSLRSPRAIVLVATPDATPDARLVGWCVSLVRQHRRNHSGRIYSIAVHPEAQGHGFGRKLMLAALAALEARGATPVFLEVRADNEGALGLYRSLGFEALKQLNDYYGEGIHAIRMRKG